MQNTDNIYWLGVDYQPKHLQRQDDRANIKVFLLHLLRPGYDDSQGFPPELNSMAAAISRCDYVFLSAALSFPWFEAGLRLYISHHFLRNDSAYVFIHLAFILYEQ